ncbi:unnamed protein product [Urochloa humidicola]
MGDGEPAGIRCRRELLLRDRQNKEEKIKLAGAEQSAGVCTGRAERGRVEGQSRARRSEATAACVGAEQSSAKRGHGDGGCRRRDDVRGLGQSKATAADPLRRTEEEENGRSIGRWRRPCRRWRRGARRRPGRGRAAASRSPWRSRIRRTRSQGGGGGGRRPWRLRLRLRRRRHGKSREGSERNRGEEEKIEVGPRVGWYRGPPDLEALDQNLVAFVRATPTELPFLPLHLTPYSTLYKDSSPY